ncbi:MAG: hypothetical protein P8Y34_05305 [Anaerolineales bacterium]
MTYHQVPSTVNLLRAAGLLVLANLACRPVITIGWGELLLLGLLAALLLGPLLFRFFRRRGERQDQDIRRDQD